MANSGNFPANPPSEEDGTTYTQESMTNFLGQKRAETFPSEILKRGMMMQFSWEALSEYNRKGHYTPVGNKYTQKFSWYVGNILFKTYKWLEKKLGKFRHFSPVGGYDWEDAEYRDFKQKTKWVEDEVQEEAE